MKPIGSVLVLMAVLMAQPLAASAEQLGVLVARCAPHVAPRTALAIISVESGGKWWAVNDNDRSAPDFATPADAMAYAERRVAVGGNIDIGLAQLNSAHLAEFHVTVREAFEPCTNVAFGMNVLQQVWATARAQWGMTRTALFHAFEAYNGGPGSWNTSNAALRVRVNRYASEVWDTALGLALDAPRAVRAASAVRVHRQRLPTMSSPRPVTVISRAPTRSGV